MDMKELEFGGDIMVIAQKEFGADVSEELLVKLYHSWLQEKEQKNQNKWIRNQLSELFVSVGEKPKWVRPDCPDWQYHKSKPMVFLGQISLPKFEMPTGQIEGPATLYVFGTAVTVNKKRKEWKMLTKVVEQFKI